MLEPAAKKMSVEREESESFDLSVVSMPAQRYYRELEQVVVDITTW